MFCSGFVTACDVLQRLCNSGDGWHRREGDPTSKLVFPCLVRNLYNDDDMGDDEDDEHHADTAHEDDEDGGSKQLDNYKDSEALSPGCVDQVHIFSVMTFSLGIV
jgi:hypothetical protein